MKKFLFSTSLILILTMVFLSANYAFASTCKVSPWKIIINDNCQGFIDCGTDRYWIPCCSDFGDAVGWC